MKLRPSRNILSNYRRALPALLIMMIISTASTRARHAQLGTFRALVAGKNRQTTL